ncbi:MAG: hypothetical protein Q7T25_05440, partial [Sideroxyarcus sp.]|nr:hypothetical protein [Sideroxyarcus sp.]
MQNINHLRPSLLIFVGVLVLLFIISFQQRHGMMANLERIHAVRLSFFHGSAPVAAIEEFTLRWRCDDAGSLCRRLLAPIARATGDTSYLERYPVDQPDDHYLVQAGWAYMMNSEAEQAVNYFRQTPAELDTLLFQLGYYDQRIAETFIALNRAPSLTHELGRRAEEEGKLDLAKSAYRAAAAGTTPEEPLHYLALGDQFLLED